MRRKQALSAAAATAAIVLVMVPGCSSSDSGGQSTTSPDPEITSVLPPIEVNGPNPIAAKVGDNLNVTTEGVTGVTTDNDGVLKVSQPSDDGSATFNAGAEVVGAGTATLQVLGDNDQPLYQVVVTATE